MYYYDAAFQQGRCPYDEELGVTSPFSAGVTRMLVKLCARLPYAQAAEVFCELTRAEAECVGISMDGCLAHVRGEGWKEIKIGSVFEVEASQTSQAIKTNRRNEPIREVHACAQSYVMHLGGPEGFGVKLAVEAEAQSRCWSSVYQTETFNTSNCPSVAARWSPAPNKLNIASQPLACVGLGTVSRTCCRYAPTS